MTSSLQFESNQIRSGAMLLAIIDYEMLRGTFIESLPALLKIPRDALRQNLRELVKQTGEAQSATGSSQAATTAAPLKDPEIGLRVGADTPALNQYTIDLTNEARAGRIDPIEGRDAEIRQIIDILMRRRPTQF